MIQKEITICGKQVILAYCFATEIAYKDLSDEDITAYFEAALPLLKEQKMPDVKKTIYLILACMMAYYEDADKAPIKDREIMKTATPDEIGTALGTIIELRAQFYHVPSGEPEDKQEEKQKNA